MMSGNLIDALQNIVAISKEAVEDGASVVPWIAINGITISGK
jgi:predicted Zn-dependent protease